MRGRNVLVTYTTAIRFTLSPRTIDFNSSFSNNPGVATPALLMIKETSMSEVSASRTERMVLGSEVRSSIMTFVQILLFRCLIQRSLDSALSFYQSINTRLKPSLASSQAYVNPIPTLKPVTSAHAS